MFKNKHLETHILFYFADMHALNAQTLKHVQIAFSCVIFVNLTRPHLLMEYNQKKNMYRIPLKYNAFSSLVFSEMISNQERI